MHFKRRGNRISLYRSHWIPKGPDVPHGYTQQTYVSSIEADATSLPNELSLLLTPTECAMVERRIVVPAKLEKEAAKQRALQHEVDPVWRLTEALRLVEEAATHSLTSGVSAVRTERLLSALKKVRTLEPSPEAHHGPAADPLQDALKAIKSATDAVQRGRYGRAPTSGVRKTPVFRRWTEILAAVDAGDNSLLRALQSTGFASRRKG